MRTKIRHIKSRELPKSVKSAEWSEVIRYYIPFCPRPKIPVTIALLEKVDALESDRGIIIKTKEELQQEMAQYLGDFIYKDSPHLYTGQLTRTVLYLGTTVLMNHCVSDLLMFDVIFLAVYVYYSFILIKDLTSTHRKFKILIE